MLRILPIFLFIPCLAFANVRMCPGTVDHILIEEGHRIPFPTMLIPDVAAGDKNRRQGWNYLNNVPGLPPLVVHCYYSKDESNSKDVPLPSNIHKCTFFKGIFVCR